MTNRFRVLAVAVASLALAATTSPALARPPAKPGTPGNLQLSATKKGNTYAVLGTWTAAANGTRYAVRLTAGGVVVDSSMVTTLSWTGHTTVPAGSTVTMQVTSYNLNRRGGATTKNLVLPDLTAPTASYAVSHDPAPHGPDVTITSSNIDDNVTDNANLVQTVDWGDGSPVTPWATGAPTISHPFADAEDRYEATVTLKDAAGNTAVFPLVVVVNDESAPTGTFAVPSPTAWAQWSKVGVSQAAINDNQSPDDKIARLINWGDGAQSVWEQGTGPTHVYAAAGSYNPTVVLADEAGNESAPLATSTIVVTTDAVKPVVALAPPKTKTKSVRSWRTLKGSASDAQTGVKNVVVKAIQKRATGWFAYDGGTRKWVKVGSKAQAWRKAAASATPSAAGAWSVGLARLAQGTLLYRAQARDNVGNLSVWRSKRAVLTQR